MPMKTTAESKLLAGSRVDTETSCMLWTRCLDKCGYGKFRSSDMRGETLVHRAAFKLWCGEIPDGMEIDHICKTRNCINPKHLRAVTHAQNIATGDYKTNHRNAVKSRCSRGHEFTPENTIVRSTKIGIARACRECRRLTRARRERACHGLDIREVMA